MNKPTPFQQGQSAAHQPYGTWFDCPYSSFKGPVEAYKQHQWFRGWEQEKRRIEGRGNEQTPSEN